MKQLSLLLIGLLAVLVTGCGFKSTETPINNNLISFTAPGETDDDVLLGVKNKKGTVLVAPADYISVTADEHLIFCTGKDGSTSLFGQYGTEYGTFESYDKLQNGDNSYYRCISGETTAYYFPGKELIRCQASQITSAALFVATDSIWEVYSYTGEKLWQLPEGAILLNSSRDITIAVPGKGKKATCKFYDVTGKEIKNLTATKWRKVKKLLKNPQTVENLQIYQMTTLELVQLLPDLARTPTEEEIFNAMHHKNLMLYYA